MEQPKNLISLAKWMYMKDREKFDILKAGEFTAINAESSLAKDGKKYQAVFNGLRMSHPVDTEKEALEIGERQRSNILRQLLSSHPGFEVELEQG